MVKSRSGQAVVEAGDDGLDGELSTYREKVLGPSNIVFFPKKPPQ